MVTRRDEPVASFVVGSRVSVLPGGDAATVRYAGLVAGTTGEWVGVEFDVPGRGKHDGTHGGVRYFATQPGGGPAGASFVRAHKLRRGVSLLEALQLKYQDGNALVERSRNEAPRPDEFYVESTRGRRVEVELVMKAELMEGQRHLDHLKRAYLPDAPVATAGPRGELGSHAQALEVLDLQVRAASKKPSLCSAVLSCRHFVAVRNRALCCVTGTKYRGLTRSCRRFKCWT